MHLTFRRTVRALLAAIGGAAVYVVVSKVLVAATIADQCYAASDDGVELDQGGPAGPGGGARATQAAAGRAG